LKKLEAELQAIEKKTAGHKSAGQTTVWITEKGHPVKVDEAKAVVRAAGDGDANINIILTGKTGEEGKKAYERALAELKRGCPKATSSPGSPSIRERTMVFGIAAAEGMKTDETVVRKLVEALQAEIKK